jgi:hypothetical protein
MKYIVELLLTYEVDAPDMRQAQITAFKRAIDLCDSEDDLFKHIDKDMKCVSSMVKKVSLVDDWPIDRADD